MIKRLLDISLSLLLLVVFFPLLTLVAVLVRFSLGSPVLFRQLRPGLHGKSFLLYKFRTMSDEKDSTGKVLHDSKRLSSFGLFLRSTSLDELPEFWNVLKGDMSLVGPRPLLVEYLERYSPEQARRHDIRPGITGWAQVNGRNALTWEEKFKLDVWYVDNQSLWLDIKISFLTIFKTILRKDVSEKGQATMTPFTGSNEKDEQ